MSAHDRMLIRLDNLNSNGNTDIPDNIQPYENTWGLKWNNSLAIQRVYEVSDLLGRAPDMLGVEPGQMAVWYNPEPIVDADNDYYKFEIQDVFYRHGNHFDFFFVTIVLELNENTDRNLHQISDALSYYPVANLLTSACHAIEPNIAILSVVRDYNDSKITLSEAQDLVKSRVDLLLPEFYAAQKFGDVVAYPTPARDILEEYTLSDVEEVPMIEDRPMLAIEPRKDDEVGQLPVLSSTSLPVEVAEVVYTEEDLDIPSSLPCPSRNTSINDLNCTSDRRKAFLRFHPDKNPGCIDDSVRKFRDYNERCDTDTRRSEEREVKRLPPIGTLPVPVETGTDELPIMTSPRMYLGLIPGRIISPIPAENMYPA